MGPEERERYEEELKEQLIQYIPFHMQDALKRYILHGISGGGFLRAVLANDLTRAVMAADYINIDRLPDYARFLYMQAPASCWGSPMQVDAWEEQGGLYGKSSDKV